jgi:hypothetical protein
VPTCLTEKSVLNELNKDFHFQRIFIKQITDLRKNAQVALTIFYSKPGASFSFLSWLEHPSFCHLTFERKLS